MKLYIKNMVCNRCILVVQNELLKIGIQPMHVALGEVELKEEYLDKKTLDQLDAALKLLGFERIDDRKARLIEKTKNIIIQIIHHSDQIDLHLNWSEFLSRELHYEYNYLSSLFSSLEGITLEQYIIRQKIERVKELLLYNELTLNEIAYKLGYSSVQHLSGQFKKITGFTPSVLKKSRQLDQNRKPLDAVND